MVCIYTVYSIVWGDEKRYIFLVAGEEITRVIIRPSGDREANSRLLDVKQTGTNFFRFFFIFNSLSARILFYYYVLLLSIIIRLRRAFVFIIN